MAIDRYLKAEIVSTLAQRMAFIGGPRQIGKTTLALSLIGPDATERHPAYLNWDDPKVPPAVRRGQLPPDEPLVVLDEIHKYARWRNLVKGLYDTEKSVRQFIVTGSARLDHYRKGGDSLAGRYRYFRLHPFSVNEIAAATGAPAGEHVDALLAFGGFPEPLLAQNARALRRWQRERLTRVVREDLRDLERVRDVSLVEQLVDLLPERVGSLLSVRSLREDLEVDHKTAEHWITILENLYVCFRVPPYGDPARRRSPGSPATRIRALKKQQKLYLWDWSVVPDEGARFENLVAAQLLKYCHWQEDVEGHRMELRFLRDVDGREVDFVVIQDKRPIFAVECKTGERAASPAIRYFAERTSIPVFYQVHRGTRHFQQGHATVVPFARWCMDMQLP
ncbi:MAG: ATP-binding protein [Acidobacteria bacterium]|nr:ATP-binding protein [Acidobacteriota bacterium]